MTFNKILLSVLFLMISIIYAQPSLKIVPDEIRFQDEFHRLVNVYFINEGNEPLNIDSLYYSKDLYYMRFDRPWSYPFIINPGDSVLMDCILSRYNLVTQSDIEDTLILYNENYEPKKISIKIDFYNDNIGWGKIKGTVKSSDDNLSRAIVYCYADGRYLYDSTYTDISGNYEMKVPEGNYTIAASKENYNLTFADNKFSPLNPTFRYVGRNSETIVDFNIALKSYSGKSISGRIFDKKTNSAMRRAIIVVRKGTHNAEKLSNVNNLNLDEDVYSGLVNSDGYFNIPVESEGYYFIQGFSDFYLPGYYNQTESVFFWQQSDTIFVNSDVTEKNIFFTRDSSFGAGTISGKVYAQSGSVNDTINNIIILVKSLSSNSLISYGLPGDDGYFRIINLPFGNYQLIAQKIGLKDASSIIIEIDSAHNKHEDVNINLNLSHVDNINSDKDFTLQQNYPNPFNPSTIINYSINPGDNISIPVQLTIYNTVGEKLAVLVNQNQSSGNYQVSFDANSVSGGLSSGLYFYQIKAGENVLTRKMLYLK